MVDDLFGGVPSSPGLLHIRHHGLCAGTASRVFLVATPAHSRANCTNSLQSAAAACSPLGGKVGVNVCQAPKINDALLTPTPCCGWWHQGRAQAPIPRVTVRARNASG